ncbi:MAG: hypothetical protein R3190_02425, partial [Thermoanaerobaculia bacterium]|nr:hypothetical protein [Thermoanaerobaculia bacterium]
GAARLARSAAAAAAIVEPRALAGAAAVLASDWPDWEPSRLTEPLYLRPAPARAPGDRSSG